MAKIEGFTSIYGQYITKKAALWKAACTQCKIIVTCLIRYNYLGFVDWCIANILQLCAYGAVKSL